MSGEVAVPRHVFISYWVEDTLAVARNLKQELDTRLAAEIFLDYRTIEAGDAWPDRLREAVATADVVLLLVGQRWLTAQTTDGIRRVDDPGDWLDGLYPILYK